MSTHEMPPMDLEHGVSATSGINHKEEGESVCFSDDVDDKGSCCSQFYSTADGYDDDFCESEEALSDVSVDIDNACPEIKVNLELGVERDCRICHMGLESNSGENNGAAIELGCSCKDDLAFAHNNCAEAWFKIKGNKTCEICNSIACNVVGPSNPVTIEQIYETHSVSSSYAIGPVYSTSEPRRCLNGPRFVNFLLACILFAFVISWLFHFNIPS